MREVFCPCSSAAPANNYYSVSVSVYLLFCALPRYIEDLRPHPERVHDLEDIPNPIRRGRIQQMKAGCLNESWMLSTRAAGEKRKRRLKAQHRLSVAGGKRK